MTFLSLTRSVRRVYEFDLADNTRIEPPTSSSRRQMSMQEVGPWSGSTTTVTVTDYEMPGMTVNGTKTLTFGGIDSGDDISLTGIPFDLEVSDTATVDHNTSPGELPNWFFANNWQQLLLVQYADAERPGDTDLNCVVAPSTCLTLNVSRPGSATPLSDNNVRGVVLAAGSDLLGNRPTAAVADYLEGNNAIAGTQFDKQQVSTTFNDSLITLPLQRP